MKNATAGTFRLTMLPGERWWGLCNAFGREMPFTEATSFACDLRVENYAHQSLSLLCSDRGRAIWCPEPVGARIADGEIALESNAGEIALVERAGANLAEAFRFASRTWFPPTGEEPELLYFSAPQLNTWIELTYHQNERDILAYAQSMLDNGVPPGVFMIDDTWQHAYESLARFEGVLRCSGHGATKSNYSAPLFVRSPGSNTLAEVVGFVSASSDANPQTSSSSAGILQTGFNQAWREAKYHPDPWFPGRGLVLHGGTYQANALESVWGYGVADKKIGDVLSLSGGLNFLNRSSNRDQNKGYAVNWVEFDSVEHDDKSTIFLWGPFWTNGEVLTADASVTNCAKAVMETIPAGALATNIVTILHGISAFAAGPAGDSRETAAHPVVPWIAFPADSSSGGWNNLAFGAFDSDGRLVTPPVRASVPTLGNQTNILDELVVNAGSLTLGSATTPCRLAKDLPIRIYANATLKLPNADSTAGKILQFDGAAGWFGKVEVGEGIAAKCKKAFIRDYPESPDWETLPRGVYGSSASAATGEFVRDDLFAGSGTLEVVTDDRIQPTLMLLR